MATKNKDKRNKINITNEFSEEKAMGKDTVNNKTNNNEETNKEFNELDSLSTKVNEAFNYVQGYKLNGLKANANDMMALYKIVSEYESKIKSYISNPSRTTGTNNTAQIVDLIGRREDASENKRTIAKYISNSMDEIRFDANEYKNRINERLSEKDRNKAETKRLLTALSNYAAAMKNEDKKLERANAKQELVDACIGYVKHPGSKPEVLNVVYDIAAVMGKQNAKAFDALTNDDLSKMSTRRYIGYQKNVGGFAFHYLGNRTGALEIQDIVDEIGPDSELNQQQKDEVFDNYLYGLYGNDRFATLSENDKKEASKELGEGATDEEIRTKCGEKIYKEMPWNKIKLDETTKSKADFAHRQGVMRQWFPDDTALLFGATAEKNAARSYLEVLSNGTYNGFFRSFKNSPEYTALMKSLYTYTKTLETDLAKDEEKLKNVKTACENYLAHYEAKDEKNKSEFAKMRRDKVKELLDSLGGPSKEKEATEEKNEKKGTLTNVSELEGSKKDVGKSGKQGTKTNSKELGKK